MNIIPIIKRLIIGYEKNPVSPTSAETKFNTNSLQHFSSSPGESPTSFLNSQSPNSVLIISLPSG